MHFALIHDGYVHAEATEADYALGIFDIRDVSKVSSIAIGWIAKPDGTYEAPPIVEAPALTPAISRAQAKIQLHRAGLLDEVNTLIGAADPEVQIWYAEAVTWQHDNPHVVAIGSALTPPISSSQIADLFVAASKIEA